MNDSVVGAFGNLLLTVVPMVVVVIAGFDGVEVGAAAWRRYVVEPNLGREGGRRSAMDR
jgi:hypothetical protein